MGPITKIDLNGDGTLDQIDQGRVEPQKAANDSCGGGLQFDVHPAVTDAAKKLIAMPNAPKGLKRFHDGMMDFAMADATNVPVFQPGGLLSVRKGQVLGEVDTSGKLIRTVKVDGLALGITRYQLDKLYRGSYEKPVEHRDLTWRAYSLSGDPVKEVQDEINLKNAVWVVAGVQTINPNMILTNNELSDAEKLLKPLFENAKALKGRPDGIEVLTKTLRQWHKTNTSPLASEIKTEPLWSEILAALAKQMGLSPADFPG